MPGMLNFDIQDTLNKYAAKSREAKSPEKEHGGSGSGSSQQEQQQQTATSRAEQIVDNNEGDPSLEHELREAAARPADEQAERIALVQELYKGREISKQEEESKIGLPEFQSAVSSAVRDSIAMNNVQKLIAIKNQAGIRRGMGKDQELTVKRAVAKGQMSAVSIPTVLLNSIRQQIGSLSSSTNQNDIVTGFLYWYFGQPDDVAFGSEASYEKIREIVEKLKINASPSRASELSLNTSEALREQLAGINEELDRMVRLLDVIATDSIGIKMRSDKTFIGIAYIIMNMLMRTAPVSKHQRLEDVDFLAQGAAWSLMDGIDAAYEYFKNTSGREIYKARHGIKPARPSAPVPDFDPSLMQPSHQAFPDDPEDTYGPDLDPSGQQDDDDYEDIPAGFDPFADDFDDMGIRSDFGPPGLDDPNYDRGVVSGKDALLERRQYNDLVRRCMAMEPDSETDE